MVRLSAAVAAGASDRGADELLVLDFSESDAEHDRAIGDLIRICDRAEVPVTGGGNVRRMEDVKKIDNARLKESGCSGVFFPAPQHIHIVFGPMVEFVRNAVDEHLENR